MARTISTKILTGIATVQIANEKMFAELLKRIGAQIIEQGVAISAVNDFQGIYRINDNTITKSSIINDETTYYPIDDSEELLAIFRDVKKLKNAPESYDLRQIGDIKEKIKFAYEEMFKKRNPKFRRVNKVLFWTLVVTGTLNALEGAALASLSSYLIALFQADMDTIISIIKASTLSDAKKQTIYKHLLENGIDPQIITGDTKISMYAKYDASETDDVFEVLSI